MIKYLCANSVVSSKCVVVPESPSAIRLCFFTDTGVIGIALPLSQAFTCMDEAFTCIKVNRSRDRFTLLKRPYDGCGAGEGGLLRVPGLRAQVSGVGEGMTYCVDYVVTDAVLLQVGPPRGFS